MGTKENMKDRESWVRGLYILLFGLLYSIAEIVLWVVVLIQFGSQLITARPNDRLLEFSRGLTAYIYAILQFVTYRSDNKPFPFDEWPEAGITQTDDDPTPSARSVPADREIVEREDEGETETGV